LSGPMVGEQKLGEGARELPLGAARMKRKGGLARPCKPVTQSSNAN
jgi:hypothetical protein